MARICSSKFFPLRVEPIYKERRNETVRVPSPESISIQLKRALDKGVLKFVNNYILGEFPEKPCSKPWEPM